jgi:hypothetical protein
MPDHMDTQFQPLTPDTFKGKKFIPSNNHQFAKDFHFSGVLAHEFPRCATIYPIVFLMDESKSFRPVCLFGFQDKENLFVREGQWLAPYVPTLLRRYPFVPLKEQNSDRYLIGYDPSSPCISSSEGQELFNVDGSPTEQFEKIKGFLQEVQQQEQLTQEFTKTLNSLGLIQAINLKVKVNGREEQINGCYGIDEKKLQGLKDEDFLKLRELHYFAPIYAQLHSMAQVERLIILKSNKNN